MRGWVRGQNDLSRLQRLHQAHVRRGFPRRLAIVFSGMKKPGPSSRGSGGLGGGRTFRNYDKFSIIFLLNWQLCVWALPPTVLLS